MRHRWVPCYFRDIPMCCLMKTTSRCESSSSAFKTNSSPTNMLVQFLMCFDTAIDAQRYNHREVEFQSNTSLPNVLKNVPIEMHALRLYTNTIFLEVQKEIHRGMSYCYIIHSESVGDIKVYQIAHTNKKCQTVRQYEVKYDARDHTVCCTCMCYTRIGYLCRHIFCVFRFNQVDKIPLQYQSTRWSRDALPTKVYDISTRYTADGDESSVATNQIMDLITQCTDRLRNNPDQLRVIVTRLTELRDYVYAKYPLDPTSSSKTAVISDVLGQPSSVDVQIHPPHGIRNKGCGTKRRLVGPGEKAIKRYKKPPRKCGKCKLYVRDHDSRNCDKIVAAKKAAAAARRQALIDAGIEIPEDFDDDPETDGCSDDDESDPLYCL